MKKIMMFLMILFIAGPVFARTVTLKSVSNGEFKNGEFVPRSDSFQAVYNITSNSVVLLKIIHNDREGRYENGTVYEITSTLTGKGLSSITLPVKQHGENILTCTREDNFGNMEILVIGKDFYQYCKTSGIKIYLEYGEVD